MTEFAQDQEYRPVAAAPAPARQRNFPFLAALAVSLVIGAALRIGIVTRSLDILDRLFVPDDTYYTLSISRSLANGLGPTADGTTLTSGFQPLLAFLIVPVFKIYHTPDAPLRIALILSSLLGLVNAGLLGRIAWRVAGYPAALAAALIWAVSPVAISASLDGLETSLALALSLTLTELWCRAREKRQTAYYILAGAAAGLALLARVDTVFLVGILGLWELARGWRKGLLAAGLAALLVVAPWWAYCLGKFGTPVPESGAAVRQQVGYHQASYLKIHQQVGWAASTIAGGPFYDAKRLQEWLIRSPAASWGLALLIFAAFLAAAAWMYRKRGGIQPWLAWTAHGGILAAFYTFYLPALWFFRRYLHQTHAVVTVIIAVALGSLWAHRARLRVAPLVGSLFVIALAASLFQSALWIWQDPSTTPDVSLHGAKGYREVTRDALAWLPEAAVLGAFQSGALGYYAAGRFTVVNLDGVVDGQAARAIRDRRLGEYALSRNVGYFVDWPFNYKAFLYFGGGAARQAEFKILGAARPQGPDRTLVSQIVWKPAK
ncbi:MAG: hypothetical protein A2W03_11605 [Candidatus Aminicenantes bacterium RBG_16_63_16]|nr:MAG: hypothetical protein A2W03_11605 [Candidatus Aminicenantes bacterium RBG_16_63_16]